MAVSGAVNTGGVSFTLGAGSVNMAGTTAISGGIGIVGTLPDLGALQFSLTSTVGGTNLPFAIGHAFKQGDVPNASVLGADIAVQVTAKNAWPDGSVKFALISGRKTLTANVPATVTLSNTGTVASGSNLTTTDLKTAMSGQTCSIACGAFGTVSWATTDFDSPFLSWVSGPAMSSWIYRKSVGSDAHLVGWIEVRLYAGGVVEVLPWVENGYLNVSGHTNKSATYTFTLGGTQRFSAAINIPHHCRTPLVSGSALSYWLGTDPGVSVKHASSYMMATEMVPTYFATVPANSANVTGLPSTFTPLQRGSFNEPMGDAGYQASLGLIPEWDMLHVTTTASVSSAIERNGYSAGRYSIYLRDETTNRPLKFSSYPTLLADNSGSMGWTDIGASSTSSYTPVNSGTAPPTWDASHHPSVGYMAYLISGRFYHMETSQFAATALYLNASSAVRENASCIFQTWAGWQSRASAWAVRTLAQACAITPDSDTLKTEFVNAVDANINRQHATYVAQPNNIFGFMQNDVDFTDNGSYGTNRYIVRTWMHDFYTGAFGFLHTLELGSTAAIRSKSNQFFHWTARRIIGRFGSAASTDYLYRDAATYNYSQNPSDTPNYDGTGPWYADWGAMYTATMDHEYLGSPPAKTDDGTLRGGSAGTYMAGYWGNLQPALSYAVRHNVSGAALARARMTSASNWSTYSATGTTYPVWTVMPKDKPYRQDTSIAAAAAALSAGQWVRVSAADVPSPTSFFDDPGTTYLTSYTHKFCYDPLNRRAMFVGAGHQGAEKLVIFDEATNTWSKSTPPFSSAGSLAHGFWHNTTDPVTGDLYYRKFNNSTAQKYDAQTQTWSTIASDGGIGSYGGIEFFPGYKEVGGLIASYSGGIYGWDKGANSWAQLRTSSGSDSQITVLSTYANVVYTTVGIGSSTWYVVDQYGTVTSIGACPLGGLSNSGAFAWCCPVTGDLIVCTSSTNAVRYRPGAGWASISLSGGPNFGSLAPGQGDGTNNGLFAAMHNYGVVMYLATPDMATAGQVWLYKYA